MNIRVKQQYHNIKFPMLKQYRYVDCDVSDFECKYRKCLNPGQWVTQSVNNNYTQKHKNFSCMERNYRGCPDNKDEKENYIEKLPKYIKERFKEK
jgi:hypothetical protein